MFSSPGPWTWHHNYIYRYTRIFGRAPRALDSPIDHDLRPDPSDIPFGLCWQASCTHTLSWTEARRRKRTQTDVNVSMFTCQHENAKTRSAPNAHTASVRSTTRTQNISYEQKVKLVFVRRLRESWTADERCTLSAQSVCRIQKTRSGIERSCPAIANL